MTDEKYAVYLPAVQDGYASGVVRQIYKDRPLPTGVELKDLIYWDKSSKLWSHRYILYSIGQHPVGGVIDNAVTQGGRDDFLLLGDSGGYQIGTGALKGIDGLRDGMSADDAIRVWNSAYSAKSSIIDWLETYCNYAMTLDMPPWANDKKHEGNPFNLCTFDQLKELTVGNLRFIDNHRKGRTKWLNVIQGLDQPTTEQWWNSVKWFECGGYAIAGSAGVTGGLHQLLTTVLMMRDDKAFRKGQWIHVLGVSTTRWAILLSAIQQQLQKHENPILRISYDSSSASRSGGVSQEITTPPMFDQHPSSWSFGSVDAPQGQKYVGSTKPINLPSPLGQILTEGDLNIVEDEFQSGKFDTVSNLFLVNHNLYVYLKAFENANRIAFETDRQQMPDSWRSCLEFIERVFCAKDWRDELDENKPLLDAVVPMK